MKQRTDYSLFFLALFATFVLVVTYVRSGDKKEEHPIYFSFYQNKNKSSGEPVLARAHYCIETLPNETIVRIVSKVHLSETQKSQVEETIYNSCKIQLEARKKSLSSFSFVWETGFGDYL